MSAALFLDTEELARKYEREPFLVHHDLVGHPLLTFDAVVEAAERLPEQNVEHNIGALPSVLVGTDAPRLSLRPREVAERVGENGCWMVLRWIHQLPEYGALLDELLDQVALVVPGGHDLGHRDAFLFLTGPGAVTPTHGDPEDNILCHVQGRKTMVVGHHPDDDTKHRELEKHRRLGVRNFPYPPQRASTFELVPGDGVYVPPDSPHWVQNAGEVSISFSIVWRPPALVRAGRVSRFNYGLRQRGLTPRAPGRNVVVDRVKSGLVWSSMAVRHRVLGRIFPSLRD